MFWEKNPANVCWDVVAGRAREGTDTLAVLPLLGTPEKRLEVEV